MSGIVGFSGWDNRGGGTRLSRNHLVLSIPSQTPIYSMDCRPSLRRLLVSSRSTHGTLYVPLYHLHKAAHILIICPNKSLPLGTWARQQVFYRCRAFVEDWSWKHFPDRFVVRENYRTPRRKRICVRPPSCRCSLRYNEIGFRCHVEHEVLTFDAGKTSEHQLVPPSYGTAAGKHVVRGG